MPIQTVRNPISSTPNDMNSILAADSEVSVVLPVKGLNTAW